MQLRAAPSLILLMLTLFSFLIVLLLQVPDLTTQTLEEGGNSDEAVVHTASEYFYAVGGDAHLPREVKLNGWGRDGFTAQSLA